MTVTLKGTADCGMSLVVFTPIVLSEVLTGLILVCTALCANDLCNPDVPGLS